MSERGRKEPTQRKRQGITPPMAPKKRATGDQKDHFGCTTGLELQIFREEGDTGVVLLHIGVPEKRGGQWLPIFPDEVRAIRRLCNRYLQEIGRQR